MGKELNTVETLDDIFLEVSDKAILTDGNGLPVYAHKFRDESDKELAAAHLTPIMQTYENIEKEMFGSISKPSMGENIRFTISAEDGYNIVGVRVKKNLYLGIYTVNPNLGSSYILLDDLSKQIKNVFS